MQHFFGYALKLTGKEAPSSCRQELIDNPQEPNVSKGKKDDGKKPEGRVSAGIRTLSANFHALSAFQIGSYFVVGASRKDVLEVKNGKFPKTSAAVRKSGFGGGEEPDEPMVACEATELVATDTGTLGVTLEPETDASGCVAVVADVTVEPALVPTVGEGASPTC
jgi:hypothetical protein